MNARPQRIQRQRTKGWRMPEGAIYVGRPSRYGNRFPVTAFRTPSEAALAFALHLAARQLRDPAEFERWLAPLVGRTLACWCAPGQPCHADVLFAMANPGLVCRPAASAAA